MNAVAVRVGQDLDLYMACARNELLQINRIIAERGERLAAGRSERLEQIGRIVDDTHPLAAASGSRLDQYRIAELLRGKAGFGIRKPHFGARHHRHAGRHHRAACRDLIPHQTDRSGRRANPGQAGGQHSLGEVLVFGQKTVTGVYGVGAGRGRRSDDSRDVEIALAGRRRPDAVGFVRVTHMEGSAISIGIDRDRAQATLATRAQNAHRDLPAIGNEYFAEHDTSMNSNSELSLFRPPLPLPSFPRQTGKRGPGGRLRCLPENLLILALPLSRPSVGRGEGKGGGMRPNKHLISTMEYCRVFWEGLYPAYFAASPTR